jgi:hypothetical protein
MSGYLLRGGGELIAVIIFFIAVISLREYKRDPNHAEAPMLHRR